MRRPSGACTKFVPNLRPIYSGFGVFSTLIFMFVLFDFTILSKLSSTQ